MDFDLDIYKNAIKTVLEKAAADKHYEQHNQNTVFYARETAGLISIVEFGNEKAKKLAMRTLENWYFTGKGKGGRSKIRVNYCWYDLINETIGRKEPKPIQGELF
jgi:hypothetical protein